MKITRLSKLETSGVALVTRAANKRKIAMAKSEEIGMQLEELFIEILKSEGEYDAPSVEKMCAEHGLDKQGTETFKAILKLANAFKGNDAMRNALTQSLPKALGFPGASAEQTATDKPEVEPEQEEPEMAKTEEKKPAEGAQTDAAPKAALASDEIAKFDAVQKAQDLVIKSLEARALAAEAAVKKLADENRLAIWVTKAEKELAFVPGKTAIELGAMLKSVEDVSAETAQDQFKVLKSVSDAMQKSSLFASVGKQGASSEKDAAEEIAEIAKGDDEVAKARATRDLLSKNDALYLKYKTEMRAKARS